jgi:hypothetical protein
MKGDIANWSLQIANCKLDEGRRIVGPSGRIMVRGDFAHQGVALGWANGCPFGANENKLGALLSRSTIRGNCPFGANAKGLRALAHPMAFLLVLLLFSMASCGTRLAKETGSTAGSEAQAAGSVVECGPVKLTVDIAPAKARLSDEPILTLTIENLPGVEVEKPPFGEVLGSLRILDSREPLLKVSDGREITEKVLTLEPTAVGRFTIDPISVAFRDKRPGADGRPQSLTSKPITVEITSAYEKQTPSLDDLHAAAGPVALSWRIPFWIWAVVALVIACATTGIWLWRRRNGEKAALASVLSPEELARRELRKLADSGWMETDVKRYFVEVTAVVRRYVERTTGIRAPEQTTEEFLREMSRTNRFVGSGVSPTALKDFLESADLVKFAAHPPRREDIEESFHRAETFIELGVLQTPSVLEEARA